MTSPVDTPYTLATENDFHLLDMDIVMIELVNRALGLKKGGTGPAGVRPHAFPLALAVEDEHVRISGVKAGKGLTHRLMDLGLPIGSEVRIVQRGVSGSVVVARDTLRVALGAGMSRKVVVTLVGAPGNAGTTAAEQAA